MTVSNTDSDNASKHVQISFSCMVPQPLHAAPVYNKRLLVISDEGWGDIRLPNLDYVLICWAL